MPYFLNRNFRFLLIAGFIMLSVFSHAQPGREIGRQGADITIYGTVPDYTDDGLYQLQVGAFRDLDNAIRAYTMLENASLNPSYENYQDLIRVLIRGVGSKELPFYREVLRNLGFDGFLIRPDIYAIIPPAAPLPLPVSNAVLPSYTLNETAHCTIKIGETRNLIDLAGNTNTMLWSSSTPLVIGLDGYGNITGLNMGNGYVQINEWEYISVAVVPMEDLYFVPESMIALLPPESRPGDPYTENLTEYRTEPTFRLAYRFTNKGEYYGASGENGGIDILGRGADYKWLWTTYEQGGWFYDLNGIKREMTDGYQKDANGAELTVIPEFIYDNGVPYLQLRHRLHNAGNLYLTGQRFGASADVMIHENDYASLIHTYYGAYMTDSADNPALELMFVGESGSGITPVDTLWLGEWDGGWHLDNIYIDRRIDIHNTDSAIGFSYQNIDLAPGETKEFFIRFTLARI